MQFSATLELNGKTATGIEVPPEIVEALGGGKRPSVRVTLGSHTYRTTVATMGGRFLIPVSAEVRAAAGVAAGDELEVTIVLDDQPRVVTPPDDLATALAADPAAQAAWEKLAYSHQKEHARAIEDAKTPETRQRRLAKAIEKLRTGTK